MAAGKIPQPVNKLPMARSRTNGRQSGVDTPAVVLHASDSRMHSMHRKLRAPQDRAPAVISSIICIADEKSRKKRTEREVEGGVSYFQSQLQPM